MAKKNGANSGEAAAQPAANLPLFFKQPKLVDAKVHAKASVKPGTDYSFATATNSILLNTVEFIEAVKHYPIIFTSDENPMPACIVGLEQANYFIESTGKWREGSYIPAYVRQYPFVFFEQKEENKFYLCIDEGSPHFSANTPEGATSLYDTEGKPSQLTQNALQFCTAFYNHLMITKNFCEDLKKHDLLQPYNSQVQLANGRKIGLGGFLMIDEKKFNELSDEVYLDFRKKGWTPFIYLALASASNWKHLVELATSKEQSKAA